MGGLPAASGREHRRSLRSRLLLAGLGVIGGAAWLVGGTATASHCMGDKDHLGQPLDLTARCGYYVQQAVTPSPSPTPTALPTSPVTVENRPNVRVVQPVEDSPLRVTVENQPEAQDGWGQGDRDTMQAMYEGFIHFAGIVAFAFGVLLMLLLPRVV